MRTTQNESHDNSSTVAQTQNLVNANSVDDIYVNRDGDQLAISSPVQTAEFHLDDMVVIYQGQMDVFQQVFEGAGQILEFWWNPEGFSIVLHDGLERHQIQFIVNNDDTRQRAGDFR